MISPDLTLNGPLGVVSSVQRVSTSSGRCGREYAARLGVGWPRDEPFAGDGSQRRALAWFDHRSHRWLLGYGPCRATTELPPHPACGELFGRDPGRLAAARIDDAVVLAPGMLATYAVWDVPGARRPAPDERVAAWSTDPLSACPGARSRGHAELRPVCGRWPRADRLDVTADASAEAAPCSTQGRKTPTKLRKGNTPDCADAAFLPVAPGYSSDSDGASPDAVPSGHARPHPSAPVTGARGARVSSGPPPARLRVVRTPCVCGATGCDEVGLPAHNNGPRAEPAAAAGGPKGGPARSTGDTCCRRGPPRVRIVVRHETTLAPAS